MIDAVMTRPANARRDNEIRRFPVAGDTIARNAISRDVAHLWSQGTQCARLDPTTAEAVLERWRLEITCGAFCADHDPTLGSNIDEMIDAARAGFDMWLTARDLPSGPKGSRHA